MPDDAKALAELVNMAGAAPGATFRVCRFRSAPFDYGTAHPPARLTPVGVLRGTVVKQTGRAGQRNAVQ